MSLLGWKARWRGAHATPSASVSSVALPPARPSSEHAMRAPLKSWITTARPFTSDAVAPVVTLIVPLPVVYATVVHGSDVTSPLK